MNKVMKYCTYITWKCYSLLETVVCVRIVDFATWTQMLGPKMAPATVLTRTLLLNTAGTSPKSV
jgi:hypothetical protein